MTVDPRTRKTSATQSASHHEAVFRQCGMLRNPFALLGDEAAGSDGGEPDQPQPRPCPSMPPPQLPEGEHPFECDAGDHAETPYEAWRDIAPLLHRLAARLRVPADTLRLYDPFYCTGRCKELLQSLGFPSVHNCNEDFYALQAAGAVPEYDVLCSNPPYTRDHLERVFTFAFSTHKPWMLLVPHYCARKPWFLSWLDAEAARGRIGARPAYLGPKTTPYIFTAPSLRQDVREKRGDALDVRAGKFQAIWFVSLGASHQAPVLEWWRRIHADRAECVVAASPTELPQLAAGIAKKKRKR